MKVQTRELDVGGRHIYFVSDLHSNLPAFEAVLTQIPDESVLVCAGDMVGYYPEPNEVCDLLRARSALCIQGNHDKYVLGVLPYPASREGKYRIQATRQTLSPENLQWLGELPDQLRLELRGASAGVGPIHVAHGSPNNVEEYLYPDTPIDFLADLLPTAHMLVLGHTHHPMLRHVGALTVVNPGSVGQPRNRVPGASYASIDPLFGQVNFHRPNYGIAEYQKSLEEHGIDPTMIELLSRT